MQTLKLLLPAISSVLVHELGHLMMMLLLGVKNRGAKTGLWGISIKADYTKSSYLKELFVSLAGVSANFLCAALLFLFDNSEYLYAMLAYGFFNMLPAQFLDGGDIVRTIMHICGASQNVTYTVCRALSISVTVIMWIVAVYFAIRLGSALLLGTVFYMMAVCFLNFDT